MAIGLGGIAIPFPTVGPGGTLIPAAGSGNFFETSGPGYPTNPTPNTVGIPPARGPNLFADILGGGGTVPAQGIDSSGNVVTENFPASFDPYSGRDPNNPLFPGVVQSGSTSSAFPLTGFAAGLGGQEAAPAYVSTPDSSGFASGLTAGSTGVDASGGYFSDPASGLSTGLGPANPAGSGGDQGLSLSPDLAQGTLGQDLSQTSTGLDTFPGMDITGATSSPFSANTGKPADWWSEVFTILGNFFQRGGLVLLGVILLGAAAWGLAHGESPLQLARKFT